MRDRIALGQTGLAVSPICLGWVEDPSTIQVAFDLGINFFFLTGDLHWPVYDASRRGLAALLARGRGVREQVVVAAASYVTQPEFTQGPFADLLKATPELEHIDILVIGGAYARDFRSRQKVYRRLVAHNGFGARAVAASFHDRAAAVTAINEQRVDLAFVRYNPVHAGARLDVFPALQPSSTRIFNFKSTFGYAAPRTLRELGLTSAHWRPLHTDYYRFALSQPAVDGTLCSLRHPREVRALNRALAAPPLNHREQQYLIDLARLTLRLPRGSRSSP
jgi:aryl-alcohol dehydrogenase-like predicted oxidoreductase